MPGNIPPLETIISAVVNQVREALVNAHPLIIGIEQVQDFVEEQLIHFDYPAVAKSYILYRDERSKARARARTPDPTAIADYIHAAKYARYDTELGRKETYLETVQRVEMMHLRRFGKEDYHTVFLKEIRAAFDKVREKKVLPSMRSMQFGGAAIEQENARLYNCSFTLVDRPRVFQEVFHLLLCGCGVGYSVQWKHTEKLPALKYVDKQVCHYTVRDSIEGWADAIGILFESYTRENFSDRLVEFNYSLIRHEGAPLHVSGGLAPGHLPLKRCLEAVRRVLNGAQGRRLRPIECSDIICHIAEAVLAGGIRRSSLMCLFSAMDTEMMYSKTPGNFRPSVSKDDPGVNNQRQMANISAVLRRNHTERSDFEKIVRMAQDFGEPGFFFTESEDYGTNPCGEIGLDPIDEETGLTGFAFCNLCEVNVAACTGVHDFNEAVQAATLIGTLQASYTDFSYLEIQTPNINGTDSYGINPSENIARRSALLGVGLIGQADNPTLAFDPHVLRQGAEIAVTENIRVARLIGIEPAQRVTTSKPGGTGSLELGCVGSGVHDHHARQYFRRITANPNEPHAKEFMRVNPHMFEKKPDGDFALVFPVRAPDDATVIDDTTAEEFLNRVFRLYDNWIVPGTASHKISPGLTHNVSATCTVREGEIDGVVDMIWRNRSRVAALSFAPLLLDKLYPFAPREAVRSQADEDRFNRLVESYVPVDWSTWKHDDDGERPGMEPACGPQGCELP